VSSSRTQVSHSALTSLCRNRYCPQVPENPQHTPPTTVHATPRAVCFFASFKTGLASVRSKYAEKGKGPAPADPGALPGRPTAGKDAQRCFSASQYAQR